MPYPNKQPIYVSGKTKEKLEAVAKAIEAKNDDGVKVKGFQLVEKWVSKQYKKYVKGD